MNSTVIPEAKLTATDKDKEDNLFYTLQEVTPVGPALTPTQSPWLPHPHLPGSQAVPPLFAPRTPAAFSLWRG